MKKSLHPQYGFETLAIHAGTPPEATTGARSFPIYQTTSYVFEDADHAASLFNLQTPGFIYSRLTNPTVAALEERLATLEEDGEPLVPLRDIHPKSWHSLP